MKKTLVLGVVIVGLMLTGCGSDGGSDGGSDSGSDGGSDLSGPQAAAAAATLEQAESGGLTLDKECVNDLAARLSDDDAEKIAADDDDADLSPEGEALGTELLGCADQDSLIDLFITGMAASGEAFDEDCARDKLQDVDIAELIASTEGGDPPSDVIAAIAECVETGG